MALMSSLTILQMTASTESFPSKSNPSEQKNNTELLGFSTSGLTRILVAAGASRPGDQLRAAAGPAKPSRRPPGATLA